MHLQNTSLPSLTRLSPQEFRSSVLALRPSVAIFDCDGTLWTDDAGEAFMLWSMGSGLLSRDACDWLRERYRSYRQGKVPELAMCGEMVQVYRGLRDAELQAAARTFFGIYIAPRVFPVMRQLCWDLKAAGTTLWAVSSTNNWVIGAAMEHFGIPTDHVLAACVRVANGVVTGDLIDIPTDEGKAVALDRIGIKNPDTVFGNSIHDAAMLALAQHAFAVNPTPELVQLAAARGWMAFQPELSHPADGTQR